MRHVVDKNGARGGRGEEKREGRSQELAVVATEAQRSRCHVREGYPGKPLGSLPTGRAPAGADDQGVRVLPGTRPVPAPFGSCPNVCPTTTSPAARQAVPLHAVHLPRRPTVGLLRCRRLREREQDVKEHGRIALGHCMSIEPLV